MDHYELVLKCTNGIYTGKFIYLNSLEPEIIGSGSFEDFGVTACLLDANLEPSHTKVQFKGDYFISDLSAQKGTWLKIPVSVPFKLQQSQQLKFDQTPTVVSMLSIESKSLELRWGTSKISVNEHITISTKQPADSIFPSLHNFLLEIFLSDGCYNLIVRSGSIYFRLQEEVQLSAGMELQIGSLEFEVCRYNYGKYSNIGLRVSMEDSDQIIQDLRINRTPVSYYGIFDGHGGHHCSEYLKNNLHIYLQKHLNQVESISEWQPLISAAFNECDTFYSQLFPEMSKLTGSAALVCMISQNNLVIVNTGDCRAVLSRRGEAIQLSNDHKPDLPSERSRIERSGSFVTGGRVHGKLNLSRAFGDFEYKAAGKASIICEPEVEVFQLNYSIDEFLVLGCDGLFEAYSNQELVKISRDRLRGMKVTEQDPNRVIKDIVTQAIFSRKTTDNVTAVLITLCAGVV